MTMPSLQADGCARVPSLPYRSCRALAAELAGLGLSLVGLFTPGLAAPPVALTVNLASLFKARERRSLGADLLASAGCVLATAGCLELFVCATLALGMVQSQFDRRCRGPVGPQQTAQADRPAQRPALPTATAQPVQQALSTQLAARQ